MRENIGLYRGKRIRNDEWAIGNLLMFPDLASYICCPDADESETMNKYSVDPETVGECSGILDKANVFIFEGDILKITYLCQKPVTAVVEFTNGKFTARYTRNGKEHIDNLTATASSLYKVIGNIHDNPELLGGNSP